MSRGRPTSAIPGNKQAPRSGLLANLRRWPDRDSALASYARLAANYEDTTTRIRAVRCRAIDLLDLQAGETVIDVACGTGAMLHELASRVGMRGRVIAVEQSPAMARLAQAASDGQPNIEVHNSPVESFTSSRRADALVFCYTHDVLQNPAALNNLFAHARPGARVAVAGLCLLPWWGAPVNAWVAWGARHYLTTWRGLRCPWAMLLAYCADLRVVERHHMGTTYAATGTTQTTTDRTLDAGSDGIA